MPVQLCYITVFYSTVLIPKWFIHWHYDPQLNKICFECKFSVWAQKKEIFFHFKAVFLNQLSHATKVSVTWDMGQNSGQTEGPVTCDWPNQSKWYSSRYNNLILLMHYLLLHEQRACDAPLRVGGTSRYINLILLMHYLLLHEWQVCDAPLALSFSLSCR